MKVSKAASKALARRYEKAGRKEKQQILDEFYVLTDYNCSYATVVLKQALASTAAKAVPEASARASFMTSRC